MPAGIERGSDLAQPRPHPLFGRDALDLETSVLGLRADVREAEKLERLGSARAAPGSPLGREAAKLDQTRLGRAQLQAEPRQPAAKFTPEALRVVMALEADDEVVGVAHDDYLAARVPLSPLVGPEVEGVVQVDVGKQRRNARSLRCAFLAGPPPTFLEHARAQPLTDQAQHPLVCNPV